MLRQLLVLWLLYNLKQLANPVVRDTLAEIFYNYSKHYVVKRTSTTIESKRIEKQLSLLNQLQEQENVENVMVEALEDLKTSRRNSYEWRRNYY
ncbi:hypothetical protein KHA80_19270 [Anaerobacillus sp. HL2]|nr:hypothetical protein KHA80_19270 [Anaerobacillus sp. HL2]